MSVVMLLLWPLVHRVFHLVPGMDVLSSCSLSDLYPVNHAVLLLFRS